jgi:hypothetical protein
MLVEEINRIGRITTTTIEIEIKGRVAQLDLAFAE